MLIGDDQYNLFILINLDQTLLNLIQSLLNIFKYRALMNKWEISFIFINDWHNPFSNAISEWYLMRLVGKFVLINLGDRPILSHPVSHLLWLGNLAHALPVFAPIRSEPTQLLYITRNTD